MVSFTTTTIVKRRINARKIKMGIKNGKNNMLIRSGWEETIRGWILRDVEDNHIINKEMNIIVML